MCICRMIRRKSHHDIKRYKSCTVKVIIIYYVQYCKMIVILKMFPFQIESLEVSLQKRNMTQETSGNTTQSTPKVTKSKNNVPSTNPIISKPLIPTATFTPPWAASQLQVIQIYVFIWCFFFLCYLKKKKKRIIVIWLHLRHFSRIILHRMVKCIPYNHSP